LLVIPLAMLMFAAGFVAYANASSTRWHPTVPKLTLGDVMEVAAKAKVGIFLQYEGVTGPPSASNHTQHAPVNSVEWKFSREIGQ
jgi:hypothetical protein